MDVASLQREIESWRGRLYDTKMLRNKFQNEKDLIKEFYTVTKTETNQIRSQIRNKDAEMERLEDSHRVELKVYEQKITHLEYDHSNALKDVDSQSKDLQRAEANYHIRSENVRKLQKTEIKKELTEQELANVARVNRELENYEINMGILKKNYDEQLVGIENTYKQKLQALKENLELRLKVEIHEVEERKNKHRNNLIHQHEVAFRGIKDYYNDITKGTLEKIKELKEEKANLQRRQTENNEKIERLRRDNGKKKEELDAVKAERKKLQDKLKNYELDKVSLFNARKHIRHLLKKLDSCKAERKDQQELHSKAVEERDELYARYEATIDGLTQKGEYKNAYLDEKLRGHEENLQKQEAKLQEVLNRVNLDPAFVLEINKRIEDSLEAKNTIMKNLKYTYAHAVKAYNDAIRVYEAKLVEFGIPPEELGFQPIESNTSTMPAGLVAA